MSRVLTLFIVLIIQLKIFYALHVRNICQLPISRCTSRSFTTTPTSLFTTITNDFDSKNNNKQPDNKSILTSLRSASSQLSTQFNLSLADAKLHPFKYLSIPIAAALIGYITNYIGVKMLFYPIKMRGLIFQQWDAQPLAMFGWQGIVPAKRVIMSSRLVDVTLSKLLNIPALFQQLNPTQVSNLLINSLGPAVALFPRFITRFFLKRACADIIINAERVVDLKTLVVNGLTQDPTVLGAFFQRVAHKELQFLIDSGFGFGFLLGLLQMVQWMVYPKEWTLVAGGALVGYVTNWIALKWIFEPLNPVSVGPFVLQGMFLKRQLEVSKDFCDYLCANVVTSFNVWQNILDGPKTEAFRSILSRNVPLPSSYIQSIISHLKGSLAVLSPQQHSLHGYVDTALGLKTVLLHKMSLLSTAEFERILHPVFEEDELTLILSGAVLGALSGLLQIWANKWGERREKEKLKKLQLFQENPTNVVS